MHEDSLGVSARIEELKEKLERDPNSKIFIQLAEEYRKSGQFEEAIQLCLAGLKRHPGYTSAHVTLGRAYAGARRNAEAAAEFQSVIAQVPDNILANRFLGDVYYEEGKVADALARYRVVHMLSPSDEEVMARIRTLEAGGPRPAAKAPAAPAAPAPAGGGGEGEGDDAFMDLKIDESLILNANMISATLKKAGAPAPPVVAPRPAPKPAAKPAPVEAIPSGEVSFDNMEGPDAGGFDDFSDFSSPTVMLNVADLAKLAEAASPPSPAASAPSPSATAPPASPAPAAVPPTYSARTADKFGLASAAPPVAAPSRPAPPPPVPVVAAPPPAAAAPVGPPAMDEFGSGEVGEDFSEFAAPTVMLNVADLVKSGALNEEMLKSKPFGLAESLPKAAPPTVAASPARAAVAAAADIEAPGADFGSMAGGFADASAFAEMEEPPGAGEVVPLQAAEADSFGTRAFQADDLQAMVAQAATPARVAAEIGPIGAGGVVPVEAAQAGGFDAAADSVSATEVFVAPAATSGAGRNEPMEAVEPIAAIGEVAPPAPSFAEEAGLLDPEPAAEGEAWWETAPPLEAAPPLETLPPLEAAAAGEAAPWPVAEPGAADEDLTSKTLGQLYLQQGHLEKALEVLGRYLVSHPGDAEIAERVGELRRRLAPSPEPAASRLPVRDAAPVAADGAEGPEERKAKIRQKLTSWLQSTKKN